MLRERPKTTLISGARPLQQNGLPCACDEGIATEGLGTGTDEEMSSMQPYNSDYGDLIQDIKTAVVEVVNAAGEFYVAANTDPEPPTP